MWPYSLVCVGSGRKPRRLDFSQQGSNVSVQLQEKLKGERDEAIQSIRHEEQEKRQDLETKYLLIVQRLQALSPVLAEFVESYILLQREVNNFPKLIKQTVSKVKKEVGNDFVNILLDA